MRVEARHAIKPVVGSNASRKPQDEYQQVEEEAKRKLPILKSAPIKGEAVVSDSKTAVSDAVDPMFYGPDGKMIMAIQKGRHIDEKA